MFKNKTILALIPARAGSKGLPGKNTRPLLGKPLVAWTIEQALASRYLDKIVVSTDDVNISRIALQYGAEVPFLRPRKLATSPAKMAGVLMHALDFFEKKSYKFDLIMVLQPTSPLRKAEDIDGAIEFLFRKSSRAVVSVCPVEHHPFWCANLNKDGRIGSFLNPSGIYKNRQELPEYFRINGAVYLAYTSFFRKNKKFITKGTYAYKMPRERSVDIDAELDFDFARFLVSRGNNKNSRKHKG